MAIGSGGDGMSVFTCPGNTSGRHFWTAWFFVGPKLVERRCNYCDATEQEGVTE